MKEREKEKCVREGEETKAREKNWKWLIWAPVRKNLMLRK